jgi:hypothetical protein
MLYYMNVGVQDNLRFLKQRIRNQKLLNKAILNVVPTEQLDDQSTLINQVHLYSNDTTFDNTLQDQFTEIMRQYVPDDNIIKELFAEIGPDASKEFIINYNPLYLQKLKRIENQRFSKSKLIAFFKDMLAENLVKKGLVNNNNPKPLQSQSVFAPLNNSSVFSPIPKSSQNVSPAQSITSPQNNYTTPTQNVSPPALIGLVSPNPNPNNNNPSPALNGPSPNLRNQITDDYDVVLQNALNNLEVAVADPKYTNKAREDILKNIFNDMRTKVLYKSPNDPSKNKQTKHNKATLCQTIMDHVNEAVNMTGDYKKVFETLQALDLVNPANTNDNIYQVLYLTKSDFIDYREGNGYKGYGLKKGLKAHHSVINNRYYVDRKKLGNGILDVRYVRNKHLTKVKPQYVSQELKNVIGKIIDEKKVDKNAYHKLSKHEQHLVRNLNQMFDVNDDIEDGDSFDERFQILLGEVRAGNTNMALKNELKQYILYGMRNGNIPKNVGYDLLMEIN